MSTFLRDVAGELSAAAEAVQVIERAVQQFSATAGSLGDAR